MIFIKYIFLYIHIKLYIIYRNVIMDELKINNDEINDLYVKSILEDGIYIEINELGPDIDNVILNKLKNKYENRCISTGFVKQGSIKIIKKSEGMIKTTNFK